MGLMVLGKDLGRSVSDILGCGREAWVSDLWENKNSTLSENSSTSEQVFHLLCLQF